MKFIITVDTEGDDPWIRQQTVTTENAKYLPRFQNLCESYGFRPTYLTAYEMAVCPDFQRFGKEIIKENSGEIGMHCHAWNSPPIVPLTSDDFQFHPYLTEFPADIIDQKVDFMTRLLENTFETNIYSHRAGRYGFDEAYAKVLVEYGYRVDSSVTPCLSWRGHPGDPEQKGGPDFSCFPNEAYFLDIDNIDKPGNSSLLEIPSTTINRCNSLIRYLWQKTKNIPYFPVRVHRIVCNISSLWASGQNLQEMLAIVDRCVEENRPYLMCSTHSCNLIPGSNFFPTEEHVEKLYEDIETLFSKVSCLCEGATLTEYYDIHLSGIIPAPNR